MWAKPVLERRVVAQSGIAECGRERKRRRWLTIASREGQLRRGVVDQLHAGDGDLRQGCIADRVGSTTVAIFMNLSR